MVLKVREMVDGMESYHTARLLESYCGSAASRHLSMQNNYSLSAGEAEGAIAWRWGTAAIAMPRAHQPPAGTDPR